MTGTIAAPPARYSVRSPAPTPVVVPDHVRRDNVLIFWLTTVLTLAITLGRNPWAFTTVVRESGDHALNSILVLNGEHQLLLTGPVSRVGFPHPGPIYLYVELLGQKLFHDWLPLTASAYGAQFISGSLLQAVLIGLTAGVLVRLTRWWPAAVAGTGVLIWFAATHTLIGDIWLPTLYMTAFALLIASAAGVTAGRTREVAPLTLASGILGHGHVAFLLFLAATWLAAGLGWLLAHPTGRRAALRADRTAIRFAAVILAAFLVPIVLELIWHFPGPWPDYLKFSRSARGNDDGESLAFFGHFWSQSYAPSVTILALSAAAAVLLLDQDRVRSRLFLSAYAILVLESALFLLYVLRGVDSLDPVNYYVGWFYETVPMFLLVLPPMHLLLLLRDAVPGRRLIVPAVTAAVALAAVGGVSGAIRPHDNTDRPDVTRLVSVLTADPARRSRPVVLRMTHDEWAYAAALILEARRTGLPMCLADPYWRGLFTPASMCASSAGHYAIALVSRADFARRHNVRAIFTDHDHAVFAGSVPNLPTPKR